MQILYTGTAKLETFLGVSQGHSNPLAILWNLDMRGPLYMYI